MQSKDRLQYLFFLCSMCTEYYEALLGWNTLARGVQIRYVTRTYVWLLLFWYSSDGEYVKNSVRWKRIHPAGPLDWCQRPHAHRKPRGRRIAVSLFLSFFGGVYPFLSSACPVTTDCINCSDELMWERHLTLNNGSNNKEKSNNQKRVYRVRSEPKTGAPWNQVKNAPHEPRDWPKTNRTCIER